MNIRTSPANVMSIEELVVAVAFLSGLEERIHELGYEAPEHVKQDLRSCERELAEKVRGDKEKRLAQLKIRQESLLTQTERRKNVEAEIAQLQAELGLGRKAAKK